MDFCDPSYSRVSPAYGADELLFPWWIIPIHEGRAIYQVCAPAQYLLLGQFTPRCGGVLGLILTIGQLYRTICRTGHH